MRSSLRLLFLCSFLFGCSPMFGQNLPTEPDECKTLTTTQDRCIVVGSVWLRVQKVIGTITETFYAAPNDIVTGTELRAILGSHTQPFTANPGETLTDFANRINGLQAGFTIQVLPIKPGETELVAQTDTQHANSNLSFNGTLFVNGTVIHMDGSQTTNQRTFGMKFADGPSNFIIKLPQGSKDSVAAENAKIEESNKANNSTIPKIQVSIRSADTSSYYDLLGKTADTEWILTADSSPFVVVTIGREGGKLCSGISLSEAEAVEPCHWQVLLCRRGSQKDLTVGMEIKAATDSTATHPNSSVLIVHRDLLSDLESTYSVNGKMITAYVGPFMFRPYASVWKIDWIRKDWAVAGTLQAQMTRLPFHWNHTSNLRMQRM